MSKLVEVNEKIAEVKRPVNVFAYVFGSISAIIMGSGMSLVMTDIGEMIGMVMVCFAYPVYNRILKKERARIAPEVLQLTDELIK